MGDLPNFSKKITKKGGKSCGMDNSSGFLGK